MENNSLKSKIVASCFDHFNDTKLGYACNARQQDMRQLATPLALFSKVPPDKAKSVKIVPKVSGQGKGEPREDRSKGP